MRVIASLGVLTFTAILGCSGSMQGKLGNTACEVGCEEAKTECVNECAEDVDKTACELGCNEAQNKCESDCKK